MNDAFEITVQLADEHGAPMALGNVLVDAVLYITKQPRYRFSLGRTNAKGQLVLSFKRLEEQRIKNQAFSVMDYNTPLQSCDSVISLEAVRAEELELRRDAANKWFPEDLEFLVSLDASINSQVRCPATDVQVDQQVSGTVSLLCEPMSGALVPNNSFKPKPLRGSA